MPRVHHRHARAVLTEHVALVTAAVGEHEVQAVAQVAGARVADDLAVLDELEVDAVPVPLDPVALDADAPRVPQVDAVARRRLGARPAADHVAGDAAVAGAGEVDGEERVVEAVVLDRARTRAVRADRRAVLDVAGADVAELEAPHRDAVRRDHQDLALALAVQHRAGQPDQLDRPVQHDGGLPVHAGLHDDARAALRVRDLPRDRARPRSGSRRTPRFRCGGTGMRRDGRRRRDVAVGRVVVRVGRPLTARGQGEHERPCRRPTRTRPGGHVTSATLRARRARTSSRAATSDASVPAAIAVQPPEPGHEWARKFRSCLDPMSGGWYVIPGTLMIARSWSRLWP